MNPDPGAKGELVAGIERTSHLIALYLERTLGDLAVTQAEAHVLLRLSRGGPTSPNDLRRLFGHKRSTLTSVCDRLEARGLVERAAHPTDRRSLLLSLTPSGRRVATRVAEAVGALEAAVESSTSARARDGFAAVLAAVQAEVEER